MSERNCDKCKHLVDDGERRGCESWNCEFEPKEGEWILYSEKTPEEDNSYLVTLKFNWGKEVEICNWIDGKWYETNLAHAIVAWKYLPEPWEGEEE